MKISPLNLKIKFHSCISLEWLIPWNNISMSEILSSVIDKYEHLTQDSYYRFIQPSEWQTNNCFLIITCQPYTATTSVTVGLLLLAFYNTLSVCPLLCSDSHLLLWCYICRCSTLRLLQVLLHIFCCYLFTAFTKLIPVILYFLDILISQKCLSAFKNLFYFKFVFEDSKINNC